MRRRHIRAVADNGGAGPTKVHVVLHTDGTVTVREPRGWEFELTLGEAVGAIYRAAQMKLIKHYDGGQDVGVPVDAAKGDGGGGAGEPAGCR